MRLGRLHTAADLNRLRADLHRAGHPTLTDPILTAILIHTRHRGLALDALLMHPRPTWLQEIAGEYPWPMPQGSGELADPRSIANDWGPMGTGTDPA
jgi:hypothetical protein